MILEAFASQPNSVRRREGRRFIRKFDLQVEGNVEGQREVNDCFLSHSHTALAWKGRLLNLWMLKARTSCAGAQRWRICPPCTRLCQSSGSERMEIVENFIEHALSPPSRVSLSATHSNTDANSVLHFFFFLCKSSFRLIMGRNSLRKRKL